MKKTIIIIIITSISLSLFAQQGIHKSERMEKIRVQKIAYITNAIQLTPAEAEVFWPIYNEYDNQRQNFERARMGRYQGQPPDISSMTDEEVNKLILERFDRDQELINLNLKYYEEFKKVLPVMKIFKLYKAEMEFRKVLLEKIQEFNKQGGSQQYRDR